MNDKDKTKAELISELTELRRRNAELVNMSLGEERHQAEALGASHKLLDTIFAEAPT